MKEEDHFEEGGRWEEFLRNGIGSMDWIDLAPDRERWWSLVNAVINLRVP